MPTQARAARRPALGSRWGRALAPYLLILPGGGWLLLFFLLPIVTLAITSLESGDFINGFNFTWNFGNYSDGFGLYSAHETGVGTCSQGQAERIKEDRLAGPRLAGKHSKSWFELEIELFNEHDILDCELPQHVRTARWSITSGRPSAAAPD